MKEKILQLRGEGKTYRQIRELLGCSKSTISYHCGDGQKRKSNDRLRKRRMNILLRKIDSFHNRKRKNLVERTRKFQKKESTSRWHTNSNLPRTFTINNVLERFGEETVCYLSGEKINILTSNEYELDHIIPYSKGGSNDITNLGILSTKVNRIKSDLTVEELLNLMSNILIHNGYEINKRVSATGSQQDSKS